MYQYPGLFNQNKLESIALDNEFLLKTHFCTSISKNISELISKENKKKTASPGGFSNMVDKDWQTIQTQTNNYDALCIVNTPNELVSCLMSMKIGEVEGQEIFELGSVLTAEKYQRQGFAKKLMNIFLENSPMMKEKPYIIVGTGDIINTMYDKFTSNEQLQWLEPNAIMPVAFDIINQPPLSPKDKIYSNQSFTTYFATQDDNTI